VVLGGIFSFTDAKAWYASVKPSFIYRLDRREDDEYDLWAELRANFLSFFDHRSQVAYHRQRNKALKFQLGEDPQSYVTAKLEVLRYIDPNLSEHKKVEKLMEGLPYQLQQTLVLSDIPNSNDFVRKLRKTSELYAKYHPLEMKPIPQSQHSNSSIFSAPMLAQTNFHNPQSSNLMNNTNPNLPLTCHYCHVVGHKRMYCKTRLRDESRGIFRNSREASNNNNSNNGFVNTNRYSQRSGQPTN